MEHLNPVEMWTFILEVHTQDMDVINLGVQLSLNSMILMPVLIQEATNITWLQLKRLHVLLTEFVMETPKATQRIALI